MPRKYYIPRQNTRENVAQKAQGVALLEYGVRPMDAARISGLNPKLLRRFQRIIRDRGYNPTANTAFEDRFFKDARYSDRRKKHDAPRANNSLTQSNPRDTVSDMQSLPSEPTSPTENDIQSGDAPNPHTTSSTSVQGPVAPPPQPAPIPELFPVPSGFHRHGLPQTDYPRLPLQSRAKPASLQANTYFLQPPFLSPAPQDPLRAHSSSRSLLPTAQPGQILEAALSTATTASMRNEAPADSPWGNYR